MPHSWVNLLVQFCVKLHVKRAWLLQLYGFQTCLGRNLTFELVECFLILCFPAALKLCRLTIEPAKGGVTEALDTDVVLVATGK